MYYKEQPFHLFTITFLPDNLKFQWVTSSLVNQTLDVFHALVHSARGYNCLLRLALFVEQTKITGMQYVLLLRLLRLICLAWNYHDVYRFHPCLLDQAQGFPKIWKRNANFVFVKYSLLVTLLWAEDNFYAYFSGYEN